MHLAQGHAGRQLRLADGARDRCDHDRLGLVRLEAGGPQSRREVARQIVSVQLPLERLAACRERLDLARDQRVELVALEAREIAVEHEPASVEPEEPPQRPIALDGCPSRQADLRAGAQLGVIRREQAVRVVGHTSSRAPARTIERRASVRSPMSSPSTSAGSGASQRMIASSMSCT